MSGSEKIVHARLDSETETLLRRLKRRSGMNESAIIRQALRALAAQELTAGPPKIIGAGKFSSGLGDLSTNKRYLDDLGKKPRK